MRSAEALRVVLESPHGPDVGRVKEEKKASSSQLVWAKCDRRRNVWNGSILPRSATAEREEGPGLRV